MIKAADHTLWTLGKSSLQGSSNNNINMHHTAVPLRCGPPSLRISDDDLHFVSDPTPADAWAIAEDSVVSPLAVLPSHARLLRGVHRVFVVVPRSSKADRRAYYHGEMNSDEGEGGDDVFEVVLHRGHAFLAPRPCVFDSSGSGMGSVKDISEGWQHSLLVVKSREGSAPQG